MTLLATQITDALVDRVETCLTAGGYTSNVGATVLVGVTRGGKPQTPCTFVTPGRTVETRDEYGTMSYTRTVEVTGYCDANAHPTLAEHALVDLIAWDLRRCLWASTSALTALIRDLRITGDQPGYREDGGALVGASLTVEIDYALQTSDPATPA